MSGKSIETYKVLSEQTGWELSEKVTEHLEQGWLLHGGPVVIQGTDETYCQEYSQAVVI